MQPRREDSILPVDTNNERFRLFVNKNSVPNDQGLTLDNGNEIEIRTLLTLKFTGDAQERWFVWISIRTASHFVYMYYSRFLLIMKETHIHTHVQCTTCMFNVVPKDANQRQPLKHTSRANTFNGLSIFALVREFIFRQECMSYRLGREYNREVEYPLFLTNRERQD